MSSNYVHVVKKDAIDQHTTIPVYPAAILSTLQSHHVRVAPRLVSISYNNLSYARLGTLRKWWDAYPVPEGLPAPFGDSSQYGIAPCWGYAEVLESKIKDIESSTLFWGFWPMSNLPVDLKLVKGDASGHWIEASEHRQTLMPLYNRCITRDPTLRLRDLTERQRRDMAAEAVCRPVWECGYLLNKHVLGEPYVHPSAHEAPPGRNWRAEKGDLRAAVVINLSAGGRTARSFADNLLNDRDAGTGPLGLLAITSSPDDGWVKGAAFPAKVVSYRALHDAATLDWIAELRPKKVIINDFGGRGDSLFELTKALKDCLPSVAVHIIGIGVEPKPCTQHELLVNMKRRVGLPDREQMNTGPVQDALIARDGAEAYFAAVEKAWTGFVARGNLDAVRLNEGEGVGGENGIDSGWELVSHGKLPADAGLVYWL